MVIAALSGGDGPDDQPDDKKYRSDVHLDLRSIVRIKSGEKASQLPVFTLTRRLGRSLPAGRDIESGARGFIVFSRSLETGRPRLPLATSRYLEAARDSLTEGFALPHPR
jgi:hypothetical protein